MATTRKAQPQFTKTAKAAAQAIEPEATPVVEKPLIARIDEWLENKIGLKGVASWKRVLTGWIVALLGAAGLGYLIGQVAGMLMVGALLTTGSLFLFYAIFALALVLSYWAGGKIGRILYKGVVFGQWGLDDSSVVFYTPRSI